MKKKKNFYNCLFVQEYILELVILSDHNPNWRPFWINAIKHIFRNWDFLGLLVCCSRHLSGMMCGEKHTVKMTSLSKKYSKVGNISDISVNIGRHLGLMPIIYISATRISKNFYYGVLETS